MEIVQLEGTFRFIKWKSSNRWTWFIVLLPLSIKIYHGKKNIVVAPKTLWYSLLGYFIACPPPKSMATPGCPKPTHRGVNYLKKNFFPIHGRFLLTSQHSIIGIFQRFLLSFLFQLLETLFLKCLAKFYTNFKIFYSSLRKKYFLIVTHKNNQFCYKNAW